MSWHGTERVLVQTKSLRSSFLPEKGLIIFYEDCIFGAWFNGTADGRAIDRRWASAVSV